MKARIAGIGFVAALSLALPASALGEEEASSVVPPENSAATQYTEAIPTASGDKEAHGGRKPSPAKVLGAKNAKKLESQGKEGREVAKIVAETAPAPAGAGAAEEQAPQREPSPQQSAERPPTQKSDGDDTAAGAGAGNGSGPPDRPAESPAAEPKPVSAEVPNGSSGIGEVIAEATGSSSSGQLGALLPLAIIATIAWSLGYFWRQRRPVE
jgi:hypothetical protein